MPPSTFLKSVASVIPGEADSYAERICGRKDTRCSLCTDTRIDAMLPCNRRVSHDSCGYLPLPSGSGTWSVSRDAPNTPSVPPKLKCLSRLAFG